jgi:hypothetical protein
MEKIGKDNRKVKKAGRVVSQMLALGPKRGKIWA